MDYAQALQQLNNIRNQALAIQSQLNAMKASQTSGGSGGGGGGTVSRSPFTLASTPGASPQPTLPNMAFSNTTPATTQFIPQTSGLSSGALEGAKKTLNEATNILKKISDSMFSSLVKPIPHTEATTGTAESKGFFTNAEAPSVTALESIPSWRSSSSTTNVPSQTSPWGGSSSTVTTGLGKGITATGAPTESQTPPPVMSPSGFPMGTGSFASSSVQTSPQPSTLPPSVNIPETAIGKYESMIRALQQQYRNPKYVPIPMTGASPYGVSAMGNLQRLLEQLQNK